MVPSPRLKDFEPAHLNLLADFGKKLVVHLLDGSACDGDQSSAPEMSAG
jgi:hypothetical protein